MECLVGNNVFNLYCYQMEHSFAKIPHAPCTNIRGDSKLVPSQWESLLQSNGISHWLGANLESALNMMLKCHVLWSTLMGKLLLPIRHIWRTEIQHCGASQNYFDEQLDHYSTKQLNDEENVGVITNCTQYCGTTGITVHAIMLSYMQQTCL